MSAGALGLCLTIAGVAQAKEPAPASIWGGALADTCALPTVVWLPQTGCSGVAIAPDLILTAAHCTQSLDQPTVVFGEDVDAPARTVATERCVANPDWTGLVDATDYGYCLLAESVALDVVPVARGCELDALEVGREVVLAGFGEDEAGVSGRKRLVAVPVTGIAGDGGALIELGGGGLDSCLGDSGGPVLIDLGLEDGKASWRIAALIIGGDQCGQGGVSVRADEALRFAELDAGRDLDPCRDASGAWAPTVACGAFAAAPLDGAGSWATGCVGARSSPSASCGPAYDASATPGCACSHAGSERDALPVALLAGLLGLAGLRRRGERMR